MFIFAQLFYYFICLADVKNAILSLVTITIWKKEMIIKKVVLFVVVERLAELGKEELKWQILMIHWSSEF